MSNEYFETWYYSTFGGVLGFDDDSNKEAVAKIWNGMIDYVARDIRREYLPGMTVEARLLASVLEQHKV